MRSSSLAALLIITLALGACSTTPSWDPRKWFSKEEAPAPQARETPGVEARLQAINSAVSGSVRVRESGDLLMIAVDLANLSPGPYRVVLHATGNCNSPNGFSAGAPWSPPGWKDPATRLVPEVYGSGSGSIGELLARVRGVRLGDALNRGVLVYQGTTPQIPQPGVPNNVVACGVFVPSKTLF
jgi:Cu/Zn superoxide dismutase